jgi:hypothetical protein
MTAYSYCICTTVGVKSLEALLEGSGQGNYKDEHPWLVAQEFLETAREASSRLPILFATGQPSEFSHWGYVEAIEVFELHRGQWETRCEFSPLVAINPIWTAIDSVFLKPSAEQHRRETLENIHQHRYALTEGEIHPYAICETPPFILAELAESGLKESGEIKQDQPTP